MSELPVLQNVADLFAALWIAVLFLMIGVAIAAGRSR